MFAGKNREDWDDLLPAVMMAYQSSVYESTGFSPYRLMFGEECTLPMDIGLPKQQPGSPESITSPYAIWVRDALEVAYEQVRQHYGQVVQRQKRLYDRREVKQLFAVGDWVMRYYTPAKKCKLDSAWTGPYLIVSLIGWALGIQKNSESPNSDSTLSGYQESPTSAGGRVLAIDEAIIGCTIGYDPRCQYYETNVAEFTFVNGGGPAEETRIADVDSDHSVSSSLDPSGISGMDIASPLLLLSPSQWKAGRSG